jgi:predicted phage terminase large subunit-like protein
MSGTSCAKKMTYGDIINNIFDLNNRYQPKLIAVKTVSAGGKSFMYELNNEMKRRGVWLKVVEVKDNAHKEDRIKGLAPLYEFGHAFHLKDCPQLLDLEDEMLKFPRGKYDDILDAYATILEIATPPNSKQHGQADDERPKRRLNYKPRSPITGW